MRSCLLSRRLAPLLTLGMLAVLPSRALALNLLEGWGLNHLGQRIISPRQQIGLIQVDAGGYHGLGLKADGTVIAWGNNSSGQCNVPAGLNHVVQVSGGSNFSLALKDDGTVVAWGSNDGGQTSVPAGLTNVVKIAAGTASSLALKSDGTVVGWGSNSWGQLNIPAGLNNLVDIAEGGLTGLALKTDGTVVSWGYASARPGALSNVKTMALGDTDGLVSFNDGTVQSHGVNGFAAPAGLTGVVQVAAGQLSQAALKSDGTCVAWGYNYNGELNIPAGLDGVISLSGGALHYQALRAVGIALDQDEVQGGDAATGTVTLPIAPGPGGTDVILDATDPSVVVPDHVHVDAGKHTATFPVTTKLVFQDLDVNVAATVNNVRSFFTIKVKGTGVGLGLNAASVTMGSTTKLTGTLSLAATPTVDTVLVLASSDPNVTVPGTVTVAAGQNAVSFPVDHNFATADGNATITASVDGNAVAQTTIRTLKLRASLAFDPPTLLGGETTYGGVTLNAPVSRPLTIALSGSDPALQIPSTVTIQRNGRIAIFPATANHLASWKSVIVSASAPGIALQRSIRINPAATLKSLTIAGSMYGHGRLTGTVKLVHAAPAGGAIVNLGTSDSALSAPAFVTVPEGQYAATFVVNGADVAADTDAMLVASCGPATLSAGIQVRALSPGAFSLSETTAYAGAPVQATLFLNSTVYQDTTMEVEVADPLVSGPTTVTVPAGSRSVVVTFTVGSPDKARFVAITLRKNGKTITRNLKIMPIPPGSS